MNAQEQQLIDELVERIRSTDVANKDVIADQRLQQGLAGTPDALYILAQTVIVQKYGLDQAQSRMQAMQTELDSLRQQAADANKSSGGSFLSHLFGGGSQASPPAPPAPGQAAGGGSWQPVGNAGYPQAAPVAPPQGYPAYGYPQQTSFGVAPLGGGGGFLQGALQTAAGVAMGEMAFQSMESLFHGFGGGGGYGGGYGRGFEDGRPSETIINNYNDGQEGGHERVEGSRDRDDSSFYNPSDDASRGDDRRDFAATDRSDDAGSNDDSNPSDDDSGNYDSGDGGFDSGDDGSSSDNGGY